MVLGTHGPYGVQICHVQMRNHGLNRKGPRATRLEVGGKKPAAPAEVIIPWFPLALDTWTPSTLGWNIQLKYVKMKVVAVFVFPLEQCFYWFVDKCRNSKRMDNYEMAMSKWTIPLDVFTAWIDSTWTPPQRFGSLNIYPKLDKPIYHIIPFSNDFCHPFIGEYWCPFIAGFTIFFQPIPSWDSFKGSPQWASLLMRWLGNATKLSTNVATLSLSCA